MSRRRIVAMATCSAVALVACGQSESRSDEAPYERGVQVGEEYDYALTTHCGIEWARVDGSWWRTEPLNDGNANPPIGWENPVERGTLSIESVDTARFTGGPDGAIEFSRTDKTQIDDPSLPDTVLYCD